MPPAVEDRHPLRAYAGAIGVGAFLTIATACGSVTSDGCPEECPAGQVCYYGTCVPDHDDAAGDADFIEPGDDADPPDDGGDDLPVEEGADADTDAGPDDADADVVPDMGCDPVACDGACRSIGATSGACIGDECRCTMADADADADTDADADVEEDVGPDVDYDDGSVEDAEADISDDAGCAVPCGAGCCAAGDTCCGGRCVNTATDFNNCGGCSATCDTVVADRCVGGSCRCGTVPACRRIGTGIRICDYGVEGGPQVCCSGSCNDVSDIYCGGCYESCTGGRTCRGSLTPTGDGCIFYCA